MKTLKTVRLSHSFESARRSHVSNLFAEVNGPEGTAALVLGQITHHLPLGEKGRSIVASMFRGKKSKRDMVSLIILIRAGCGTSRRHDGCKACCAMSSRRDVLGASHASLLL